jgi:hypothetical protein
LSLAATLVLLTGSAYGQAHLVFSGGSGSPISLTLTQPVVFTITTTTNNNFLYFTFQNAGNPFNQNFFATTGDITFTINGGAPQSIDEISSGFNSADTGLNDVFIDNGTTMFSVAAGDVIQLNAGTETTNSSIAAAAPMDGSYSAFIGDDAGNQISTLGEPVPEPQAVALVVVGGLGLAYVLRNARRDNLSPG